LGDGVRVLTRTMKKIPGSWAAGTQLRDRSRSVKMAGAGDRAGRPAPKVDAKRRERRGYRRLLEATGRVAGTGKRFASRSGDRRQAGG